MSLGKHQLEIQEEASKALASEWKLPAWGTSLLVHIFVLSLLATQSFLLPAGPTFNLSAVPDEEPLEKLIPKEVEFSDEPQDEVGALSESGDDFAAPTAPQESMLADVQLNLQPVVHESTIFTEAFDESLSKSPVIDSSSIKGVGSFGTTGAVGAVDRLTHEITVSIDQRPTLVIWLFDASGSLKKQRDQISERLEHVYKELGILELSENPKYKRTKDKPLLSVVASFGEKLNIMTPEPTDKVDEIIAAVEAVKADTSGKENVFQSITFLAQKYRQHRIKRPRRNVMIIIFTDESGDDYQQLDTTVMTCRKLQIPVHVVGIPAPFGHENTYVKYVDPNPKFDQSVQWLPVNQGPESLFPERLQLGFRGAAAQDETIDSGFGPFALTRLAYETGGLFFAVHPNRNTDRRIRRREISELSSYLTRFFDPQIMRSYQPDYISVKDYEELLNKNASRKTLVQAAKRSWTTSMGSIQLRFPKQSEAQLANALSTAQRQAAKLEPKINMLCNILRQGESDFNKLTKPRWQAGYALAFGRSLAVKVRSEGYNSMLAAAKQGMKFKNKKNDTWLLRPIDNVTTSSSLAKDASKATKYLQLVVNEHPGTPWAYLAQRELEIPFGWEWSERFTGVQARIERQNNPRPPRPPRPENEPAPKKRRTPKL